MGPLGLFFSMTTLNQNIFYMLKSLNQEIREINGLHLKGALFLKLTAFFPQPKKYDFKTVWENILFHCEVDEFAEFKLWNTKLASETSKKQASTSQLVANITITVFRCLSDLQKLLLFSTSLVFVHLMTAVNNMAQLQVNILVNTKRHRLVQKPDSRPSLHQGATKASTVVATAEIPLQLDTVKAEQFVPQNTCFQLTSHFVLTSDVWGERQTQFNKMNPLWRWSNSAAVVYMQWAYSGISKMVTPASYNMTGTKKKQNKETKRRTIISLLTITSTQSSQLSWCFRVIQEKFHRHKVVWLGFPDQQGTATTSHTKKKPLSDSEFLHLHGCSVAIDTLQV